MTKGFRQEKSHNRFLMLYLPFLQYTPLQFEIGKLMHTPLFFT